MKKTGKLLIFIVLLSVVSGISANTSFANASLEVEYNYDDGHFNGGVGGRIYGVHFSTTETILLKIKLFFLGGDPAPYFYDWVVRTWDMGARQPGSELASGYNASSHWGWHEVNVGPIEVSREFFIEIKPRYPYAVIGYDNDAPIDQRSYEKVGSTWDYFEHGDLVIHVVMLQLTLSEVYDEVQNIENKLDSFYSFIDGILTAIQNTLSMLSTKINEVLTGLSNIENKLEEMAEKKSIDIAIVPLPKNKQDKNDNCAGFFLKTTVDGERLDFDTDEISVWVDDAKLELSQYTLTQIITGTYRLEIAEEALDKKIVQCLLVEVVVDSYCGSGICVIE